MDLFAPAQIRAKGGTEGGNWTETEGEGGNWAEREEEDAVLPLLPTNDAEGTCALSQRRDR